MKWKHATSNAAAQSSSNYLRLDKPRRQPQVGVQLGTYSSLSISEKRPLCLKTEGCSNNQVKNNIIEA